MIDDLFVFLLHGGVEKMSGNHYTTFTLKDYNFFSVSYAHIRRPLILLMVIFWVQIYTVFKEDMLPLVKTCH